jgi:hydroxymethylglutaryl-CoA lyase
VPEQRVLEIVRKLADAEPEEIALADTIGVGTPGQVSSMVGQVAEIIAPIPVRVHFHNTRNMAIANVWAAIASGATIIDSSIGGIGGCPFAPNATGNVATEDVIYLLNRSGIAHGLEIEKLIETARWMETVLGKKVPSMLAAAGNFPV